MYRKSPSRLLVAAENARPLVSIKRSGNYLIDSIDCFADEDTRKKVRYAYRTTKEKLGDAVLALVKEAYQGKYHGVVIGSGFEAMPSVLAQLKHIIPLYGNNATTVARTKDPKQLFTRLQSNNILSPAVFFEPNQKKNLFVKSIGSSGGRHIKSYVSGSAVSVGQYLQEKKSGRERSILFLAKQNSAFIIGIQKPISLETTHGYDFQGVIHARDIAPKKMRYIQSMVMRISRCFALQGICGLDVLLDGTSVWVLDINPRPTASLTLYSNIEGLFDLHLQCFTKTTLHTQPKAIIPTSIDYAATAVVYAKKNTIFTYRGSLPEWIIDQPKYGSVFSTGEPICSLISHGHGETETEIRLQYYYAKLKSYLKNSDTL